VFVSLVDYASTDSTPFLCDLAEAVMTLLGISFRIVRAGEALEPDDPLELDLAALPQFVQRLKGEVALRVSYVNQASMVCSMDWKEHNGFFIYNDRWRTRE
jgi:hypothetical protein